MPLRGIIINLGEARCLSLPRRSYDVTCGIPLKAIRDVTLSGFSKKTVVHTLSLYYELRITNYELRITNYELGITNYELRIIIILKVQSIAQFGSVSVLGTCDVKIAF